jgi:8-oxo-dGTP pyrophosphatase MutT (NUDIX family)
METAIRETIEETGTDDFEIIKELHKSIVEENGVAYNVTTFLAIMHGDITTEGIEEGIKTTTIPIHFLDDPSIVFLPDYFKEIKEEILKYLNPDNSIKVDPVEFKKTPKKFIPHLSDKEMDRIQELLNVPLFSLSYISDTTGIGYYTILTINGNTVDITDYSCW